MESATIALQVDSDWYLDRYPDVRRAVEDGRYASALDHFVRVGIKQGLLPRRPNVDESWYRARYSDVDQAIRKGEFESGFEHFVHFGYREDREPSAGGSPWV